MADASDMEQIVAGFSVAQFVCVAEGCGAAPVKAAAFTLWPKRGFQGPDAAHMVLPLWCCAAHEAALTEAAREEGHEIFRQMKAADFRIAGRRPDWKRVGLRHVAIDSNFYRAHGPVDVTDGGAASLRRN